MIGLDTTALIDAHKQDKSLKKQLAKLDEKTVLNDITYLELCAGLDPTNNEHKKEEELYEELYNATTSYSLTKQAAKKARDIIWQAKQKGKTIQLMDATIAAIYLSNNVNKVLTRNTKDFENIQGLEIISY